MRTAPLDPELSEVPSGTGTGVSAPAPRDASAREAAKISLAFRRVYDEHCSMVWRGLLRLGVPEHAIEDAVQDVFMVVHRRGEDFAARSSLKTWIYGIAVHVAKDYRRAQQRQRRKLFTFEHQRVAEPMAALSPAEHAEQQQAAAWVSWVLGRLPEQEREVLVLVELMDLTPNEAAEALGLGLRTCQRKLQRAREGFERALEAASAGATLSAAPPREPAQRSKP